MVRVEQCAELLALLLLGPHTLPCTALHRRQPIEPIVTLHQNTNNVAGAPWRVSGTDVKYLGLYNTTQECQWACLNGPPPTGSHCCAFTFHTRQYEPTEQNGWNRQCFGVISSHWSPTQQENITSGRVQWPKGSVAAKVCTGTNPAPSPPQPAPPTGPCASALDCSLNGACHGGVCQCHAAWTGDRCQTLALEPASLTAGYRHVFADGTNASSWGGSVLWSEEDKLWHMWAAEMVNSCPFLSSTRIDLFLWIASQQCTR
jgi:hypothetical protein